jgi:transcriptional regulator with XRE-family HTH domain
MKTLEEHRKAAYLTLRELAEKAGVALRTVWRIENGEYESLQPRTMRKIAGALGVPPSEVSEFAAEVEVGGKG